MNLPSENYTDVYNEMLLSVAEYSDFVELCSFKLTGGSVVTDIGSGTRLWKGHLGDHQPNLKLVMVERSKKIRDLSRQANAKLFPIYFLEADIGQVDGLMFIQSLHAILINARHPGRHTEDSGLHQTEGPPFVREHLDIHKQDEQCRDFRLMLLCGRRCRIGFEGVSPVTMRLERQG